MTLPEMADVLGVSVPALKMRLSRGRDALREKLAGLMS
jgi:DNA-directed RNA polymerase specialized sigma24 family protein